MGKYTNKVIMKIPFITFEYDYYWNQFVCGFGWLETKHPRGVTYWRRLFGILKPYHKDE